ncbi:hypothetical protein EYF80_066431 [Liparis tanakae]|uniref:Uncharacterized protein n=1 Tax=Liparis tanakae TaxID=230148 RepID=A0A4Z2E3V1_9TELE|nr:hypothetical protein EYF80_066431 [Liparis tanakae]
MTRPPHPTPNRIGPQRAGTGTFVPVFAPETPRHNKSQNDVLNFRLSEGVGFPPPSVSAVTAGADTERVFAGCLRGARRREAALARRRRGAGSYKGLTDVCFTGTKKNTSKQQPTLLFLSQCGPIHLSRPRGPITQTQCPGAKPTA